MQIKPITNDEQWLQYLKRSQKNDEGVLAFMRLMVKTYPMGNWLHSLSTRGRKNKRIRLLVMCWDYYDSLTPERRYECFNRYFDAPLGKDHHFFCGYERPTVK
ncbi:hypothetical protein FIV11_04015 [Lactiplantibacillus plantarum]|uniref:hypothetical protein n=1 Tax=Lactiplantibacillus plantarum TaxID=1590 RepID=UPI0026567CEB|nr:hypothetical protein [Lactiplantibacillus plantarum]MDN7060895.1 hypothetical protein [Lactiplantibacillus plantarum]